MGSEMHYDIIGNTHGIVKSTIHDIIHHFVEAVASKWNEMIKLPVDNDDELAHIKCGFHHIAGTSRKCSQGHLFFAHCTFNCFYCKQNFSPQGYPGVIGLIEGVHVYIEAPPRNMRSEQYVGGSDKMSIKNQMVCNHTGRITNLVSKWPSESSIFVFVMALPLVAL